MLALYTTGLLLILGWLFYRLFFDPLAHVPGPFIAKFFPFFYIRMTLKHKHTVMMKELHDTYGPVVRFGPSDVCFATTSAFESIYGFAGDKNFVISGGRRNLLVPQDTVVDIMLSNCATKEIRSWLRPMVTSTINQITGTCSEQLFNVAFEKGFKLHRVGQVGSAPIRLSSVNDEYMWDLGSLVAFGRHAEQSSLSQFQSSLETNELYMCFLEVCLCFLDRFTVQKHSAFFSNAWGLLGKLFKFRNASVGSSDQRPVSFHDNHYARLKAAAEKSGNEDISDLHLQINSTSTQLSIYATSNAAINCMFYYLLKNPACLTKVEGELLSAFQSYHEINEQRLATLPYLNACINEVLRMAPPFCAGLLQRTSKGATVDGIYIPPGTGIQADPYSLGNSEEYWESAGSFRPERWLDPDSRKNEKASRPFLIGSRQCPGKNMALQFIRMAVGKTVYLYQMELINKELDIARDGSSRLVFGIELDVSMKPRVSGVLGYE